MMLKRLLAIFLSFGIFLPAGGFAQSKIAEFPRDVVAYSQKVETCIHFSGEVPYDKERAAQINQAVQKSCHGVSEQGHQLRLKYKNNGDVLKEIDSIAAQYKASFADE